MKYKVYIDTWIISQTVLYYCALMLTAQLLRATVSRLRLVIASLLGGLLGLLIFLPVPVALPLGIRFPVIFLLSGVVMLIISFRLHGRKQIINMLFSFFVVLLLLEGFSIFCYSYLPVARNDVGFLILVLAFFFLLKMLIVLKRRKENSVFPISIEFEEGEELALTALLDTGNRLSCEGKCVCIVAPGSLSDKIKEQEKFWIDYHGVGSYDERMACYHALKIVIYGEYGEEIYRDVYVAESKRELSGKGRFQAILPARNQLEKKQKNIGGIYGLLAQKAHSVKRKNK